MEVRIASETDKKIWDQFVDREGASFHHYFDWKYYYEDNPLKNRFVPLIIENNASDILGIFPIEENLRLPFGSLISLPLGTSNGFVIKGNLIEQEKKLVIQTFLDFIDSSYSDSHALITIREPVSFSNGPLIPTQILIDNGYNWLDNTTTKLPCTYYLKLEKPFKEKIWNGLLSKKFRKRIRHARKSGAVVIIDDEFRYLDEFIEMQIQIGKKFGHVPKKKDIKPLFDIFKKKIKLFICLLDSKPISAALCYSTPTMMHLAMAPYNTISQDYLTNTLPICSSIRYACEYGYSCYDMGLTTTPQLAFHKEKFGATRIPLRIYTKKFSHWKVTVNETYEYIRQSGNIMIGSLRR